FCRLSRLGPQQLDRYQQLTRMESLFAPFFKNRTPYDSVSLKDRQLWVVKSDAVLCVHDLFTRGLRREQHFAREVALRSHTSELTRTVGYMDTVRLEPVKRGKILDWSSNMSKPI